MGIKHIYIHDETARDAYDPIMEREKNDLAQAERDLERAKSGEAFASPGRIRALERIIAERKDRIAQMTRTAAKDAEDPRIGMLIRNGKTIWYAYVNGIYVEHPDKQAIINSLAGNK